MRFLFIGAGALGCYVGGALAQTSHQVGFVERPQNIAELQANGINLTRNGQTRQISNFALYADLSEAATERYDVIVCTLKSFDTPKILTSLRRIKSELPRLSVLSLQNGIENESIIAEAIGFESVISGTVTSAISKGNLGEVTEETCRGIGIDKNSPISTEIIAALNEAGLKAQGFQDAQSMKWSKLITNLQGSATSAIFDLSPKEIFTNKNIFDIEMKMLRECLNVMKALNLKVVDLPGTPVKALAFATKLPYFISQPILVKALGSSRGAKMPSLYLDLRVYQAPLETPYLYGAVVKFGAENGIPTPYCTALTKTLELLSNGDIELNHYRHNPELWLAEQLLRN